MENSNNFNNKQISTDPVTIAPQPTNAVLIEPIGQEPIVEPIPTAPIGQEPIVEPIPNAPVGQEPIVEPIPNAPVGQEPIIEPIPNAPVGQEPIVEPIPTAPVGQEPIIEPIPNAPVGQEPIVEPIPNAPVGQEPIVEPIPNAPIGQEPIVEPIPTAPVRPEPFIVEPIPNAPVGQEPIIEPIPNAPVRPEPQPIDQIPNEPIKPEPQPIPPTVTTEPFIVEPNTPSNSPEENNMQNPEQDKATLRDKFNIHDNQDFEKLLAYYAHLNKSYYTAEGQVHSQEEMRRRKNINAQLKRILANKAKEMSQNENGENFSSTLTKIENGELFSHNQLKEIAENKVACLKLFEIMARGVYEKDGQKIRLTQKQRIALASTLELVSEFRLDKMNAKLNANSQNAEISNESVLGE